MPSKTNPRYNIAASHAVDEAMFIAPQYGRYEAAVYMFANGVKPTVILRALIEPMRTRLRRPRKVRKSILRAP
jgi:hypothetical protein